MKPKFQNLRNLPLTAIALAFAGVIQSAQAATDTWSGASSGAWDTVSSNWLNDGSDTLFNSGNDALFTGTPTNNVTSATGLNIGTISLDSSFTGTVTLTGANTVAGPTTISGGVLSISAINQLGASAITLDGGTLRSTAGANLDTNAITVSANGGTINSLHTAGTFRFQTANRLLGSGPLGITGNGTLPLAGTPFTGVVVLNVSNSYDGDVTVQDGGLLEYANATGMAAGATVTVNNNGGLSTAGQNFIHPVTVNAGGTLAFQNNNNGIFSGPITLNGATTIRMQDWYGGTTRNGAITSTISGSGSITANAGTGAGGTLTLRGFDARASSADLTINSTSLLVDSSAGTAAASVTRANSLTILDGNLTVNGVGSQNTNDVFGTLNLNTGPRSAGVVGGGYTTWTITPNVATGAALTFTNMGTRTAGSVVWLAGTVGSASPGTAAAGNIFFTNGLSGSNLIGAGGALASGTASVIPWMRVSQSTNIYGYDATVGVATITKASVDINSATAGQNVADFNGTTLSADRTVNSLDVGDQSGGNYNLGTFTLTVSSGVIMAGTSPNFNGGTLDFGTAEAQLTSLQAREMRINSSISGSGGLTFVGYRTTSGNAGRLILSGANTYTGVSNFYNYGNGTAEVRINHSLALQNTTVNHVGRGYNLVFGNGGTSGQTAYTFGGLSGNANLNLNNNNTTVDAVALTVGGNNESTTYSGILSSTVAGGSLTKTGNGTLTLTGANTYTGDTTVNAGILAVNGAAIADTGKLVINGGKVAPTGTEIVSTLYFGGSQQASGTWGATGSGATHIDNTHFSGTTGVVSVVPAGYSGWATTNAGGQTADLDYDLDGVSNGVEYFMGIITPGFTANPAPDGTKTVTWTNGAGLPVGDYGTQYVVQKSTDLVSWAPVPNDGSDTNLVVTAGSVQYTINGAGKQFVRLMVTPN